MKRTIALFFVLAIAISCGGKNPQISTERKSFEKKWGDCGDGSACAEFKAEYDSLVSENLDVTPINDFIKKNLLEVSVLKNGGETFDETFDKIVREYKNFRTDIPEAHFGWSFAKNFFVEQFNYPIIALRYTDYDFTGGAHGNQSVICYNYKFENGKPKLLENVFDETEKKKLVSLIVAELKNKYGLASDEPLSKAGFWEELDKKFPFNDNFLILKKGLLFVFNQYDIAPYAMGAIEVFIPYEKFGKNLVGE